MTSYKKYKIARAGVELGVLDLAAISSGIKSGHLLWTDDCWGEGDAKWGKLTDLAQLLNAPSAPSASRPTVASSAPSASSPVVAKSSKFAWIPYAGLLCGFGILAALLFGLFRQTKWEYSHKKIVFPDSDYIDKLRSPVRWEYTYVSVPARSAKYTTLKADRTGDDAISAAYIDREKLKSLTEDMTKEGWELAGTAMEIETAYPNFGKDEYVTGLRENVRPQALLMMFRKAVPLDHGRMAVGRAKQDDILQAYCGRMGEEGWELISLQREPDADIAITFKRIKR